MLDHFSSQYMIVQHLALIVHHFIEFLSFSPSFFLIHFCLQMGSCAQKNCVITRFAAGEGCADNFVCRWWGQHRQPPPCFLMPSMSMVKNHVITMCAIWEGCADYFVCKCPPPPPQPPRFFTAPASSSEDSSRNLQYLQALRRTPNYVIYNMCMLWMRSHAAIYSICKV